MTEPSYSLTDLRDIVEPPPVSWWPPAPGVWLIGGLIIVWVIAIVAIMIIRYHRNAYRRQALAELESLKARFSGSASDRRLLSQLNALLKRTTLATYPREMVASLSGTGWLAFLDQTGGTVEFSSGIGKWLDRGYCLHTATPEDAELMALFSQARQWIVKHRLLALKQTAESVTPGDPESNKPREAIC